jgi:uncharacterized membrane protein YgcG
MIRLLPNSTTKKQLSLKNFLLIFFICSAIVTWIGLSAIQADDTDPGDYVENSKVNFQNAAQRRHAKNIAIKAVLQDDAVMEEISDLKESGEYEAARALFKEEVRQNMCEISNGRAEGWGWSNIAKYYEVHPKYLGLGHYKHKATHAGLNDSSQNKNRGLALGHSKDKGGGHGVGHGGGNGHGNGGGNGGGHDGGKK